MINSSLTHSLGKTTLKSLGYGVLRLTHMINSSLTHSLGKTTLKSLGYGVLPHSEIVLKNKIFGAIEVVTQSHLPKRTSSFRKIIYKQISSKNIFYTSTITTVKSFWVV
jgi:hypothetical protein